MAYLDGYSSDEYDRFLSEEEYDEPGLPDINEGNPLASLELTLEQKLSNVYFAILNGHLSEVIEALDEGIDVNIDLKDGWFPLLLASSVGNVEIVTELIRREANVNLDKDKYTPLMAVCACPDSSSSGPNKIQIIDTLIEHGADIEAITRRRATAFMYAASNENIEVLEHLITFCKIDAEDNQGWTALFWAVSSNNSKAVELLLGAGLRIDKLDIRGHTPLHYAISQDFEKIVKLLTVDDEQQQTTLNALEDIYNIEEMFRVSSPQFSRDILGLLYGMKCEQLFYYFSKMDLLEFLSLDNNALEELGIELPYQRYQILTGLHKFHGHVYKQKSIPIIPKDEIYRTIDIGCALVATIRQLVAMEASIKYIAQLTPEESTKTLAIPIKTIRMRLHRIKKSAKALNMLTSKWDSEAQPADLITRQMEYPKHRRWVKYLGCISVLTFSLILYTRTRS